MSIKTKLLSYSNHGGIIEKRTKDFDCEDIDVIIQSGRDLFGRWYFSKYSAIDLIANGYCDLPEYIINSKDRFSEYFVSGKMNVWDKIEFFMFSHGLDKVRDKIISMLIAMRTKLCSYPKM